MKKEGYNKLYPTQEEAFKAGALNNGNLVLSCPTASGKTLVAEICIVDALLKKGGKAVYLLPLRALASEKYEDFKKYKSLGLKVALTSGDLDTADPHLARYDIIIATNEKMDSLIRHNVNWLREIKVIVVDEIHVINDPSRGVTLEILIAKLRRVAPHAKILALSATISNSSEIAEWLNAKLVENDWRPVPLKEGVLLNDEITFNTGESKLLKKVFEDEILDLTVETLKENGQVLIFTNTRKSTITLSKKISKVIEPLLKKNEKKNLERLADSLLKSREQTNLGLTLSETIRRGAAFHNAGLPYEYRRIVEEGFKNNLIKVVVATPTLSAGLNMPARRVIIKDYRRYDIGLGYTPISVLEIKQMAGRAGRPKYDEIGEAVLIAHDKREFEFLMTNYVFGEPERIWSKLATEPALRTHILSSIATKFTETYEELIDFLKETFYAKQYSYEIIKGVTEKIINYLAEEEMIVIKQNTFKPTLFGKRISELYIDPKSGEIIKDALFTSHNKNITEFSFLHLIAHTPDMEPLYLRRKDYEELEIIADAVRDEILVEIPDKWENVYAYEFFLSEIKTASLINDWINEESEEKIEEKYDIGAGDLQRIVETAEWLIHACYEIAKLFKYDWMLPKLLTLEKRISKGVKEELLELAKLKGVGRVRARALFNAGYKTIMDLKKTEISELVKIPLIGPGVAKKILEQIGGVIDRETWRKLSTGDREKQLNLENYRE